MCMDATPARRRLEMAADCACAQRLARSGAAAAVRERTSSYLSVPRTAVMEPVVAG